MCNHNCGLLFVAFGAGLLVSLFFEGWLCPLLLGAAAIAVGVLLVK